MLRETRGALLASGATAGDSSFEATAPISLPNASRPLPPKTKTADAKPVDLADKVKGFALALALGKALPPAPSTEDGLTAPCAWHPHRPVLATVDGGGRVLIHDDPARRCVGNASNDATHNTATPTTALRHALHQRARALAWRPCAGATLAVAGGDGVCVLSRDPGATGAAVSSLAVDDAASVPRPTRARAATALQPQWHVRRLVDNCDDTPTGVDEDPFRNAGVGSVGTDSIGDKLTNVTNVLASTLGANVTLKFMDAPGKSFETGSSMSGSHTPPPTYDTLAWSPDGTLLVAGSIDRSGISVWDIATGKRVKISNNPAGVQILKFSNCGNYLFTAHPTSGFTVWSTETWKAQFWSTSDVVTAAAWGDADTHGDGSYLHNSNSPSSPCLLVASCGGGCRLSAAHFSSGAPHLDARILPVDLPRAVIESSVETTRDDASTTSPDIVDMSWEPSGRRLAVMFETDGKENTSNSETGKVGLFATRLVPVIRASLIGYIGGGIGSDRSTDTGNPTGPARAASFSGPGGGKGWRDDAGDDQADASATLAVCWEGGGVSVVPVFL